MPTRSFEDLGIIEPITRVLAANNYTNPTPIQRSAIPALLEAKDMLGIAQTGTGKTAAFALPILQRLFQTQKTYVPKSARALVLAPTRELAIQITDNCHDYGQHLSLRQCVIFGGVSQNPQVHYLSKGVDLLIATPGRLLDLIQQGYVDLKDVSFLVLDEADRMLDMGFIKDIKKIIATIPRERQTMLFSATMPPSINALAHSVLRNPVKVEVTPQVITVERIEQRVYSIRRNEKNALLITLLQDTTMNKVIVFSKTKHGANRISSQLENAGIISAAIHGNKSQGARQKALEAFKNGKVRVLVATDIVARGIDVDNISHVINYDLPDEPESYVHRIGRTARAGTDGIALAFCDETEGKLLRDIERLIKRPLTTVDTPALMKVTPLASAAHEHRKLQGGQNKNRSNHSRTDAEKGRDHRKPNRPSHPKAAHRGQGRKA
jgi:ATP-dependent RNA helicase RhlE